MAMQSIIIKSCKMNRKVFDDIIEAISRDNFYKDNKEGFIIHSLEDDYIKVFYLQQVISMQSTFDIDKGTYIKEKVEKLEAILFALDYTSQTVDIYSSKNKVSKIMELLGRISEYRVVTDDVVINPIKIISNFRENNILYDILKIRIKDFMFADNIVGDCNLNMANCSNADEILINYIENITQVSISVKSLDSCTFTFSCNGIVKFYKDIEYIDNNLIRLIKKSIN